MNYDAMQRLSSRYHHTTMNELIHRWVKVVSLALYMLIPLLMGDAGMPVMARVWFITLLVGVCVLIAYGIPMENFRRAWSAYMVATGMTDTPSQKQGRAEEIRYYGSVIGYRVTEFAVYEAVVWAIIGLAFGYRIY